MIIITSIMYGISILLLKKQLVPFLVLVASFAFVFIVFLTVAVILSFKQPFCFTTINDDDEEIVVNAKQNELITPLLLSNVPWNCFSPSVNTNQLPKDLNIFDYSFSIRGMITSDIPTTTVDIDVMCSNQIVLNYGKVTFKMCESKVTEDSCIENSCHWSNAQNSCTFNIVY